MDVNGQFCEVKNTCGIHVMTTVKNIYDYLDNKQSEPVQGFEKVINNYLNNGGDRNLIFKRRKDGTVGTPLSSGDFRGFLQQNKIGMNRLNFFEFFDFKTKAAKDNKNENDVIKEYKNDLRNKIKDFLVSYMKGKDFAPIANRGVGHWTLLAQYDEKTKKVLKLDSAPCEAEWIDVEEAAEKFVGNGQIYEGCYVMNFEMPMFKRTEGINEVNVNRVGDFTSQKQQEIIKNLDKIK